MIKDEGFLILLIFFKVDKGFSLLLNFTWEFLDIVVPIRIFNCLSSN
jgi:hypothetical protein